MEERCIIQDSPTASNPDRAAVAALLTGAVVWGLIWYPYRALAAASSWFLAGEAMGPKEWLGGAMIVAASLFSGRLDGESA